MKVYNYAIVILLSILFFSCKKIDSTQSNAKLITYSIKVVAGERISFNLSPFAFCSSLQNITTQATNFSKSYIDYQNNKPTYIFLADVSKKNTTEIVKITFYKKGSKPAPFGTLNGIMAGGCVIDGYYGEPCLVLTLNIDIA
jgi:hypothetical protein